MCDLRNRSVIEAIQKAAQEYGLKGLAPQLDKRPSTLYAELNPWSEPGKAKLGLDDALEIMRVTGDLTGLHLAAAALGFRLCAIDASDAKPSVAEELADDVQKLGAWAEVCMDPGATKAQIDLAAAAIHKDVDETWRAKLAEAGAVCQG